MRAVSLANSRWVGQVGRIYQQIVKSKLKLLCCGVDVL